MNISFLISQISGGGAERVVSVLAHAMKEKGHTVRIIITSNSISIVNEYQIHGIELVPLREWEETRKKKINRINIIRSIEIILYRIKKLIYRVVGYDISHLQYVHYCRGKARALTSYLKNNPTDILYSFMDQINVIAGLAAKHIDAKIVMAERNYHIESTLPPAFIRLRNKCYLRADYRVFQTEEQMNLFPNSIHKRSVVIPNPINDCLPEPFIGMRRKIIVTYCKLAKQKNLPLLIGAFNLLLQKQDYKMEIYGRGPLKEELKIMIERIGLSSKIELFPFDPKVHNKIKDCTMFVMTSDYEGMPNALAEAMAIGLPCISTDCLGGGARALIEDGVNGLLIPRGDVNAVAAAMEDLIEHPEKAERLARNAVKIRETLNVKKIAEQWLALAE